MKIKRMSVLLALLAVTILPGCASVQSNALYSMWQERAYSAYGMPAPPAARSPFMSAVMPYSPTLNNPLDTVSASMINVSHAVSSQEEKFISQYYSLQ
ncbi:hypothetical protein J9253_20160 [Thiothrix litoralis]|jgi:hypothetical protein|uniref:Lipoprotein n=1 Tax=Thiothrix litoralis TaxID=2891210 RepID=A0ABX7WRK2_9GAMM|nr:hypothetical protein [Thiothrix litoralis]QTR46255.1 hypothetical protein J9253_20160 [Thiothrix litoralis]